MVYGLAGSCLAELMGWESEYPGILIEQASN